MWIDKQNINTMLSFQNGSFWQWRKILHKYNGKENKMHKWEVGALPKILIWERLSSIPLVLKIQFFGLLKVDTGMEGSLVEDVVNGPFKMGLFFKRKA